MQKGVLRLSCAFVMEAYHPGDGNSCSSASKRKELSMRRREAVQTRELRNSDKGKSLRKGSGMLMASAERKVIKTENRKLIGAEHVCGESERMEAGKVKTPV